jgi:uncharacterized protein (DUF2252 family)
MVIADRVALAQRREFGKAARQRVRRADLGPWLPPSRTEDALGVVRAQEDMRLAELLPIRHSRMAESQWTYFRGAAAVMATDLAATPHTGLEVQLCGDAHVLNFGLWATPERNLSFDLRDFDETLPGPFEWDVKRLMTSLVVLARDNGLPDATADDAIRAATAGYRRRMARYATAHELEIWYDRIDVGDLLKFFEPENRGRVTAHIERQATRRTSRGAFKKLTIVVDGQVRIQDEPPYRVRVGDVDQIDLAREIVASYRASLPEHVWHLLNRFTFVDVVRQVVGVGSVGMRVYLVLLEGRLGDDPLFLQVKQAGSSVYERHLQPSEAGSHGARVVNGKRMLQAATDIFAGWTSVGGMDFYVRQFRDMKIIPDSARIAPQLVEFAAACGEVLARAHARTGDAAAIATYIGSGDNFADALVDFARSYADQNERDHRQLAAAIADGELSVPVS